MNYSRLKVYVRIDMFLAGNGGVMASLSPRARRREFARRSHERNVIGTSFAARATSRYACLTRSSQMLVAVLSAMQSPKTMAMSCTTYLFVLEKVTLNDKEKEREVCTARAELSLTRAAVAFVNTVSLNNDSCWPNSFVIEILSSGTEDGRGNAVKETFLPPFSYWNLWLSSGSKSFVVLSLLSFKWLSHSCIVVFRQYTSDVIDRLNNTNDCYEYCCLSAPALESLTKSWFWPKLKRISHSLVLYSSFAFQICLSIYW